LLPWIKKSEDRKVIGDESRLLYRKEMKTPDAGWLRAQNFLQPVYRQ
jgi:hypothetical protein